MGFRDLLKKKDASSSSNTTTNDTKSSHNDSGRSSGSTSSRVFTQIEYANAARWRSENHHDKTEAQRRVDWQRDHAPPVTKRTDGTNIYIKGLHAGFPEDEFRKELGVPYTLGKEKIECRFYREELNLMWAFWSYVASEPGPPPRPGGLPRLTISTTDMEGKGDRKRVYYPINSYWKEVARIRAGESVDLRNRHMPPDLIGMIVYRAIWGKDAGVDFIRKVEALFDYTIDQTDHANMLECSSVTKFGERWVPEMRDAFRAWASEEDKGSLVILWPTPGDRSMGEKKQADLCIEPYVNPYEIARPLPVDGMGFYRDVKGILHEKKSLTS